MIKNLLGKLSKGGKFMVAIAIATMIGCLTTAAVLGSNSKFADRSLGLSI